MARKTDPALFRFKYVASWKAVISGFFFLRRLVDVGTDWRDVKGLNNIQAGSSESLYIKEKLPFFCPTAKFFARIIKILKA